uniref:Sodium/potassium/calcium exchanger 6 n=1 Tax=Schistosoma mansoni TaxID=6183 RepID=A0A5K4F5Q4_SCHMA
MNLYKSSVYSLLTNLYSINLIIIFCTFLLPTNEIGFRGPVDSNIFAEIEGDAPNSSICRRMFSNFTEPEIRCLIAKHFPGCQFDSGFFQYLVFQYCNFDERIAPTVFMIFWLILLLGAFATISDSFFSTSLIALARSLRMSQNLAGVTLLAFGNGAPDVFSAVTAITTGDPDAPDEGLGLGFLLGSGLLVNTVTAGLVIFLKPFKISRRPFLKDTIFYMIAVSWAASILIRRKIYFADAIGFLVFYLVYVLTTWVSSTYMHRQRRNGTHSILPLFLQNTLSKPLNMLSRKRQNLSQMCGRICPQFMFLTRIRKKINLYQFKKSKSSQNHVIIEDGMKNLYSNVVSEQVLPEKTVLSATAKVNGNVELRDREKVTIPNIHVSDKRINNRQINAPKIEITSPKDIDDLNSHLDHSSYLHGDENVSTVNNGSLRLSSDFKNYLNPPDGVKKRASSLVSTEPMSSDRRLSTEHSGLSRGRCRRAQSVFRRRPSSRMSSTGYELSYMVRWIIANRELKEKSMGSRDGETRRSQKSPYDPEEQTNENVTSGNNLFGRKGSHRTSNLTNMPSYMQSPTLSDYSIEEDTLPKSSLSLKKIKLNVLPSDLETGKQQIPGLGENDIKFSSTSPKFNHQEESFKEHEDERETTFRGEGEEEKDEGDEEIEEEEMSWLEKWAMKGVWHHFAYYMIPIDVESWPQQSVFSRFLQILQTPIFLVFRLTIPTVIEELADDTETQGFAQESNIEQKINEPSREISTIPEENKFTLNSSQPELNHSNDFVPENTDREPVAVNLELMHGWCKPLNVFQCLLVPALWPMLLTANGKCIGLSPIGKTPIPIFCPFLASGFIIALTVFFTSKWNQPPRHYHRPFFATLGFITSIIWIYALAHELVNSLETLGIVWEISEAILGLSVMALASSIGDIMSNCLLARNGYPRIAYAACLGSPLFNLLLGAGLSYTVKIGRADVGYAYLSFTLTQALLFSCLLAVLTLNILTALIGRFQFYRYYGIVLIIIYLVFVTTAILIEVDVIVSPVNWNLATGTE